MIRCNKKDILEAVMGLLEKILLKSKEADAPMVQEDENIENTQQNTQQKD